MSLEPEQATADDLRERSAIDRSVRYPVMFFFTSAAAWLFVATVLGFFSSLKLQVPTFWENCEFLTYGRVFPMHMNALVYGWAMQAGIGVMIWLMARLTRVELGNSTTVVIAGHVWNLGVSIAVLSNWLGFGRSIPWLDFPSWLWPMLGLTYLMILVWLIPMFQARRTGRIYISELFVIGAAVWFPWIFATANIVISDGASAVMGAGVNAWFITNLIYFWFAPISLAVAYYLIPKIAGRPIHSYPLARLGFWTLAIMAGWTGFNRFAGGPFPAWMPAVGGAATIFILLAVVATGANQLLTLKGKESLWGYSPALRFTMLGSLMFVLYAVLSAGSSLFMFGKSLQFSHFLVGLDTLAVYGFFSMTMFGAIYFITPRITRCEWPSSSLIQVHFWLSAYGIGTIVLSMLLGGLAQGAAIMKWDQSFLTAVAMSKPWLVGRSVAWFLIAFGNLFFFYQLALMFAGKGRKSEGPTLLHVKPGEAESAEAAAGLA